MPNFSTVIQLNLISVFDQQASKCLNRRNMRVFNVSLTLQVLYLRTIHELDFSCKGYYSRARKDIANRNEGNMKADPDQTANTPTLEYWGQGGCQHKAQKLISPTSNFICHLVGVEAESKHERQVLLIYQSYCLLDQSTFYLKYFQPESKCYILFPPIQ